MLKKFFLNVLSAFMGAWLAIVLSGICLVIVVLGIIGIMAGKDMSIPKNAVLKINLSGQLLEREQTMDIDVMDIVSGGGLNYQTVETLVAALDQAKKDDDIKAVYLDCGTLSAAPASINAVRAALVDYKKSGKKIYAYADQYSQSSYFIATAADELYLNPVGSVDLHGLGGETMFYKGLFDKIGLEFQAVRVGKGKSAIEPYTRANMSDTARTQLIQLLDTIWDGIRGTIATSRGLSPASLDSLISKDIPAVRNGEFAKSHKLVDGVIYRHEFEKRIADAVGQEDGLENFASPSTLAAISSIYTSRGGKGEIAVLYACGGIDTGMEEGINSEKLVGQILSLGKDDDVKGLVLRVNSPGGSAFGSEQIWEALEWFKKQNKTVAVSMGDYAASGGYYISCGADRIFADRFTITGSIGIFGLIPNIEGLLDKIGVNMEMVATNPEAVMFTLTSPLNDHQLSALQQMVEEGYGLFTKRCAEGRKLPLDSITSVADGRPIAAPVALRLKLIDEIGSLRDAVKWTAARVGIEDDYRVGVYPEVAPNFLLQLAMSDNLRLPALFEGLASGVNLNEEALRRFNALLSADRLRAESAMIIIKM